MQKSEEILKQANIVPLLRLVVQKEGGGTEGTGPHKVKLLEDKIGKRVNPRTGKEEYVVIYFVEEDGIKKRYPVPLKGEDGQVHYLIQRIGPLAPGTEVILEYKRREGSVKGFIDVKEVIKETPEIPKEETISLEEISDEEIPIIEDEEYK